jgi:hypothetical protein
MPGADVTVFPPNRGVIGACARESCLQMHDSDAPTQAQPPHEERPQSGVSQRDLVAASLLACPPRPGASSVPPQLHFQRA